MKSLKCHKNCSLQQMNCLMKSMLIAYGLTVKERKNLSVKYSLIDSTRVKNRSEVFSAILAKMSYDEKILMEIGKILEGKFGNFASMLEEVKDYDVDEVKSFVDKVKNISPAAVIYAFHVSDNNNYRTKAFELCHDFLLEMIDQKNDTKISELQSKAEFYENVYAKANAKLKEIQKENRLAQKEFKQQKRENQQLNFDLEKLRTENEKLKAKPTNSDLQKKIKKLIYENNVLKEQVKQKEHSHIRNFTIAAEVPECKKIQEVKEQREFENTIKGKRVLVIGGLDRLENRYREVFNSLGAECLYHSGNCNGSKVGDLESLITKSNLVVFIMTINSHTAMYKAKKECKKTGTEFFLTQRTGPSAIKTDILKQINTSYN